MLTKKTSRSTKKHLVKKRKKIIIRKCTHRSRPIVHLPSSKHPKINVAAPRVELAQPAPIVIPAPVVNVPTSPPPNIHVAAPNVELTQPAPIVIPAPVVNVPACPPPNIHVAAPNVELTQPSPIVIPAPIVNVTTPESSSETELRSGLLRFVGDVIEVINSGGAGAGGNPPNQVGVLESVGQGTFVIRPTVGNPDAAQVIYYSIRQITGFRPSVTVPSRNR
ncbi:hypothetical protein D3C76_368720 [compost metagenome]